MLGRRVLFGLLIIVNLYLLLTLIWGKGGFISYLELDERYNRLETRLEEYRLESLDLSRAIRGLTSNPERQRQVVREQMNYMGKNEFLYIFPSKVDALANEAGDEEKD